MKISSKLTLLASAALCVPTLGMATTLGAWNLDNVVESTQPAVDDVTDFSVVYQGDPATAETNGRIAYTPPEAISPGLVALNDPYTSGQGTFDGCIRAEVGGTDCATGFQTGNRFKLQLTDTGSVDLVFDVSDAVGTQGGTDDDGNTLTPGVNTYQVFGRAVNLTTQMLDSFVIELGYGVGDGFTASTANDGLSFAQSLQLGPNNLPAFTQYPFGLFGDAPTNNATLDGFFDNARSGFDVEFDGEDAIKSTGFYGGLDTNGDPGLSASYEERFGYWLSREMAPAGLLWDNDGDPLTDALVMAWQLADGTWEALRDIVDVTAGTATSILTSPLSFADQATAEAYFLTTYGQALDFEANIEDLANLNLNFGIELADTFMGWSNGLGSSSTFTLRLTSFAQGVHGLISTLIGQDHKALAQSGAFFDDMWRGGSPRRARS